MARLPLLVTSLPPQMSRLATNGEEIGAAYQKACIDSWRDASFDPISVNSTNEDYPHAVRKIPVHRDASAVTGRPHVYLEDMLAVAAEEAEGKPFVLTNSDILLALTADLSDRVMSLQPGELIFSRRIDIDDMARNEGSPWHYGYDFFAVHPDDVFGLSTQMVFGAPWWDHFFPLMMYIRGCRILQSDPNQILHLKHDERWSWSVWEAFGQRFLIELNIAGNEETYRLRLRDTVEGRTGRFVSDLKYNFLRRLPWNAARGSVLMLHRVSDLNLSFLDGISLHSNGIDSSS